jgi:hypothetical protein
MIVKMQKTIINFIILIVKQRFCPVTNEMQSVMFSVSYFKLTIVLNIPKIKTGIVKMQIVRIE